MQLLTIRDLTKTYPNGVRALQGINLTIPAGMFGLLGPNGAGKSTLMRTIATLQEPDTGTIQFGDIDVLKQKAALREVLGYLPQEFGLYPNLAAEHILDHFAVLKGLTTRASAGPRSRRCSSRPTSRRPQEGRRRVLGRHEAAPRHRHRPARQAAAHHRRRADRRPRPDRAPALPQPARGDQPGRRRHPQHAHRRGRRRAVPQLRDHRRRRACSTPARRRPIVASLQGKIWRRVASKAELPELGKRLHVISTRLITGRPVVHVHHEEAPGPDFESVAPDLEDVYFYQITRAARRAA
jgi:ABC-2 type transport system ATP-binding protein